MKALKDLSRNIFLQKAIPMMMINLTGPKGNLGFHKITGGPGIQIVDASYEVIAAAIRNPLYKQGTPIHLKYFIHMLRGSSSEDIPDEELWKLMNLDATILKQKFGTTKNHIMLVLHIRELNRTYRKGANSKYQAREIGEIIGVEIDRSMYGMTKENSGGPMTRAKKDSKFKHSKSTN